MSTLFKKIFSIATTLTVAVMMVGPMPVRALTAAELQVQIDALMAQLAVLQAQLTELEGTSTEVPAACSGISFDRALKQGMSGTDVKCLQALLNQSSDTQVASSGAGSPGSETTYFGSLTKAAVIKFQEKYASEILASWGLTTGTGYVGSTTRTKLNSMVSGNGLPADCECTSWTNDVCGVSGCATTEMRQTRTCTPSGCATEAKCVDDSTCGAAPTSGLKISISSDSPGAVAAAKGAYDKVMAKINFAAGEAVTITKIIVKRDGVSADTDVAEVKIFDGATQLGSTQALNTITHKATFSSLSWAIAAGQTKVLTIKANIAAAATQGNVVTFGIQADTDVVNSENVTVSGAPIYGNNVNIAGTSVGTLDVDQNDNAVQGEVISGATDQKVGSFKFSASSTEGFDVQEITITEIGTSVSSDISNIKLKYLGETLATVATLTNDEAVFSGSPLFSVAAGTNKDIDIYADIASGVISTRTIRFEVSEYGDVSAVGQNTGGIVRITYSTGTSYSVQRSSTWTIRQGTLTVALDGATTPSATSYVKGSEGNKINAFKFSAGSREGLKVTKLRLTKTNGGSGTVIDDSEFQSVKLYVSDVDLGYVGSISSGVITFQDENGLFTVPKSGNTVIMVKADITTAADTSDKLGFYIADVTHIEIKGASSDAKIQSTTDNITISAIDTAAETTAHTVVNSGNLTVSSAPDTPAARSITLGTDDLEVFRLRLAAEYEDMRVSSITVRTYNDATTLAAATANVDTTTTDYLTNARLYDGTTLLNEQVTPSAGYITFATNFVVSRDSTKTLKIIVNIPTSLSATHHLSMSVGDKSGDSRTAATDLTTTGISSAVNITETGGGFSSNFSLQTPTLTVQAASVPPSQSVVTNTSDAWLARLQLTSAYEDIKVTRVRITLDNASAINGASSAEDIFVNLYLKKGDTKIGTTKQVSDAGGDNNKDIITFDGIDNLTVPKDQTISLDVYATATATSTDTANMTWYAGHASSTDIVGAGVYSNTTVNSSGNKKVSAGTTVRSQGTLTLSKDADTPVDTNVAVGATGVASVVFNKLKFEALYEDIKITHLKISLTDPDTTSAVYTAGNYDFDKVYLYDGTTKLAEGYVDASANTVVFVNETGLFTVPNSGEKVITVKADLFGTNNGVLSGDAPKFYIANLQDTTQVRALGASSNASTSATDPSASGDNPETAGNFGAMYLYKTNVTVAKNASCPSGTQTAGANADVFRFDATADSKADAVINEAALKVTGSADLTGTGNAYLYKSTDLTNALATEYGKSYTLPGPDNPHATTWITTTDAFAQGIPVGGTLHIRDASASTVTYYSTVVREVHVKGDGSWAKLVVDTLSITPTGSDIVYYQPLQPGNGKMFFGAYANLATTNTDYTSTTVQVDSTDGFSLGDRIQLVGYTTAGTATSSATLTVATTTATTLFLTSAALVRIDFDYYQSSATDADVDYGIVRAVDATNTVEETVSAGTTKTFVVKGDTTGAASTKSIGISINAATDFNWDDKLQRSVEARTLTFPIATTLNY